MSVAVVIGAGVAVATQTTVIETSGPRIFLALTDEQGLSEVNDEASERLHRVASGLTAS